MTIPPRWPLAVGNCWKVWYLHALARMRKSSTVSEDATGVNATCLWIRVVARIRVGTTPFSCCSDWAPRTLTIAVGMPGVLIFFVYIRDKRGRCRWFVIVFLTTSVCQSKAHGRARKASRRHDTAIGRICERILRGADAERLNLGGSVGVRRCRSRVGIIRLALAVGKIGGRPGLLLILCR